MIATRFDTSFEAVKETLSNAFINKRIAFGTWGSKLGNVGYVKSYDICNVGKGSAADEDSDANVTLVVNYTIAQFDDTGFSSSVEFNSTFDLYSTIGDNAWTNNMKMKVFDGNYPSTVAVDKDTAKLYFVFAYSWGIEFKEFALLPDESFEALEELNTKAPYRIRIDPEAMFLYIDGAEGTNYLRKNLIVEFDCGRPVIVRASERTQLSLSKPWGIA